MKSAKSPFEINWPLIQDQNQDLDKKKLKIVEKSSGKNRKAF